MTAEEKKMEQAEMAAQAGAAITEAAVYVVQRLEEVDIVTRWSTPDPNSAPTQPRKPLEWTTADYWVDVATIPLPPKSMRKSAIRRALAEAGVKPEAGMDALQVRVLDAESGRVHVVPVVVAEPTFDI